MVKNNIYKWLKLWRKLEIPSLEIDTNCERTLNLWNEFLFCMSSYNDIYKHRTKQPSSQNLIPIHCITRHVISERVRDSIFKIVSSFDICNEIYIEEMVHDKTFNDSDNANYITDPTYEQRGKKSMTENHIYKRLQLWSKLENHCLANLPILKEL